MTVGIAQQLQVALREGSIDLATATAAAFLGRLLGESVGGIRFTLDAYSLNSVSGTFTTASGAALFFKFHTEEGEEESVGEYYQAEMLARAGLPVDVPVAYSSIPGSQIVVYPIRHERRMADVVVELERSDPHAARLPAGLASAQRALDSEIGRVLVGTLREPTAVSAEAGIHQLFHQRLVTAGSCPGGRYASWYLSNPVWQEIENKPWVIDGVAYPDALADIVDGAERLLRPSELAKQWVATAHGDDHAGNIWVVDGPAGPTLRLFDPAFASESIPALLAPVKATYHNVFAHPFWLYYPELVTSVTHRHDDIVWISTDRDEELSPLRAEILASLTDNVWLPLFRELRQRDALPPAWRALLRAALVACPLLVTNLLAGSRSEAAQYLGLANVVQAGVEPAGGDDPISRWLDRLGAEVA
jgi:hypothetical protein